MLYHAVHGLCRVDEVTQENQLGKETLCYSLVPKIAQRMKTRFVIAETGMEESGFHALVSLKKANEILEYLGSESATASPSVSQQNQAWGLARTILSLAQEKFEARDQKKRQILERSAKGLVGELACVFKMTLKETSARVQRSLRNLSRINPSVLTALAQASED